MNFAVERDKEEGSQVAGLNFTVERDKEEWSQVAWILKVTVPNSKYIVCYIKQGEVPLQLFTCKAYI